ncbi:MAG: hypothetical protein HY820_12320 [Acidobacteria bacterium]|nr:hypothetical protein [Acidobacteriota bacterium]
MRNRLVALAAVLALVGVVGSYYNSPLLAQVRAALVSDVDNPARNPVRLSILASVNDRLECRTFGYTVPTGKRLVIDDVSAGSILGTSNKFGFMLELLANPASSGEPCTVRTRIATVPFRPPAFELGVRYHASAHERMQVVVDPGESIGVELYSVETGASTIAARYSIHLSGHLVGLP